MSPGLADALCTRCGLCCDGSLFGEVELAGHAESTRMEILGLDVEEDDAEGGLVLQPCAALRRRRCGVYAHRPECCRTFECRLMKDARRGAKTLEQALGRIAGVRERILRAKTLLSRLGQRDERLTLRERCADALAMAPGTAPGAPRRRAELEALMPALEDLLRTTFLGD